MYFVTIQQYIDHQTQITLERRVLSHDNTNNSHTIKIQIV